MISRRNSHRFTRAQSAQGGRRTRGFETAEDVRGRALLDAKGLVLREGMFYTSAQPEGVAWQKRRALFGRTDQVELVYGGEVRCVTGESLLTQTRSFLRGA